MEELKKLLTEDYLNGSAESHLSVWFNEKYKAEDKESIIFILGQHDDGLEIENVEEILKRKLSTDEITFLIEEFHKAIIKNINFDGASQWRDTLGVWN